MQSIIKILFCVTFVLKFFYIKNVKKIKKTLNVIKNVKTFYVYAMQYIHLRS